MHNGTNHAATDVVKNAQALINDTEKSAIHFNNHEMAKVADFYNDIFNSFMGKKSSSPLFSSSDHNMHQLMNVDVTKKTQEAIEQGVEITKNLVKSGIDVFNSQMDVVNKMVDSTIKQNQKMLLDSINLTEHKIANNKTHPSK